MKLIVCALLIVNLSILITESKYVPTTCQCPQARRRVLGPLLDFSVTPKGPSCLENEIIVTQKKTKRVICLSPGGRQGKRLLKCWQRMQKAGMDHKKCLGRLKQGPRQRKMKSKRVRS